MYELPQLKPATARAKIGKRAKLTEGDVLGNGENWEEGDVSERGTMRWIDALLDGGATGSCEEYAKLCEERFG